MDTMADAGARTAEGEDRTTGQVVLLCVGPRADQLVAVARSAADGSRCCSAKDDVGALRILEHEPVDAVLCGLEGNDGLHLFELMRACFPRVLRVLVFSGRGFSLEAAPALTLASAVITLHGVAGISWLVGEMARSRQSSQLFRA
jgi:hypothetical protein